jgi:hypothetical protein
MSTFLEDFVVAHPAATLSHTKYGQHFYLGYGVNIVSSPAQRLQFFVENGSEGTPYRFLIVGRLSSFKVVEDAVGSHFYFTGARYSHPTTQVRTLSLSQPWRGRSICILQRDFSGPDEHVTKDSRRRR